MAASTEPIAIIGLSCRFPGGADTPSKLWNILREGRQTWTDVPEDRWNWKSFHHPHPEAQGAQNARGGCFLEGDISRFDAGFFNMPPPEAHAMDPQHRLQLESAYEAIENAGIPIENLRGSDTGVFMAVASRDYDRMAYKDTHDLPKYHLTGVGDPVLCGRISYVFDLRGPSFTLDTGCSGSMVCLHQAVTSLRNGESTMALVGGTHVLLGPDLTMTMSLLHMMNDDGRCYAFDSRGAGYGRAEGVATVALKRLSDAIADGDPIRAVLRQTGSNSDGKTNGILLPSSSAQQALMQRLYTTAEIDPSECGYVEAHGTGTAAGDAAETNTISNIFCNGGERDTDLFVGSVKANIGHTEATSGLAGLIKVVLMLEKSLIPPVPGIEHLKDNLNMGNRIKIPRTLQAWPQSKKRLASINSFGFGGSNAHCIVEAAPERSPALSSASAQSPTQQLFVVSAKAEKSLKANIERLQEWTKNPDQEFDMGDLAYTLAARRSMMLWRYSTVASDRQSLIAALGQKSLRLEKAAGQHRVVFVFTGQGAQWAQMGRETEAAEALPSILSTLLKTDIRQLIGTNSIFRFSLLKSDKLLHTFGCPWNLIEELSQDKAHSKLSRGDIAQPSSTAIQIALVDLMRSLNIAPHAVIGHSSGELGAAYCAGYLTHETTLRCSYQRSFVSTWSKSKIREKGAMMAVGVGEKEISQYISRIQNGKAVVACQNSPSSATISGDESAIDELKTYLDQDSIFARKLQVDTAYHSHHMQAVADNYLESLAGVQEQPSDSGIRFFSSVTGQEKTSGFDAPYWVENLVSKVRFSDALEDLARHCLLDSPASVCKVFLELGPHSALTGPTRQIMSAQDLSDLKYSYLSCLKRGQSALDTILDMSGKLYEQGVQVDLKQANAFADERSHHVVNDLVPYAWDHSVRYWNESRLSKEYRMRNHPPDELLGSRIPATSLFEPVWRNVISSDTVPYVTEHIIDNFALFPGSAYLCMAMQALTQILSDRQISGTIEKFVMRDIIYSKALIVPSAPEKIEIQLSLRPSQGQAGDKSGSLWQDFRLTSVTSDGAWNEHCRGSITALFEAEEDEVEGSRERVIDSQMAEAKLMQMKQHCQEVVDTQEFYNGLRENGIDYGEHFTILKDIHIGDCKTLGTIGIPDVASCMPSGHQSPHVIHPATMDAVMHIVLPLYSRHCSKGAVMLISVDEVTVSTKINNHPGQELTVSCDLSPAGPRSGIVDWKVFQIDDQSKATPVVTLSHGEFRGIGEAAPESLDSDPVPICYQTEWGVDVDYQGPSILRGTKEMIQQQDLFQRLCSQIAVHASQMCFKTPHMKILEIKAGSGTVAAPLLQAIMKEANNKIIFDQYTFSSSSADQLDVARSDFKQLRESVAFKTLDLNQDPLEQGFESETFDLVVATGLIRVSRALQEALLKARVLLRPGGRLLLGECDMRDRETTTNDRPRSPAATRTYLKGELESALLSNVEIEAVDCYRSKGLTQFVTATATAGYAADHETPLAPVRIFSDSLGGKAGPLMDQLCESLSERGYDSSILSRTSIGKVAAKEFVEANATCVYIFDNAEDVELTITRLGHISQWARSIVIVKLSEAHALPSSALTNFVRSIRKENKGLTLITVEVQEMGEIGASVEAITKVATKSISTPQGGEALDHVIRQGQVLIPRLKPAKDLQRWIQPADAKQQAIAETFHQSQRPLKLHVETPGLLNSLVFVSDEAALQPLGDNEVEIKTMAIGVNQTDVSVALGRAKPSEQMIGEFAGVVTAVGCTASTTFSVGDRVCGWSGNAYASRVRVNSLLLHRLPGSMSFSEGASIPLAFEVAYEGLVEVARLRKGQTVLIHSAAGAVGQAAIMIAQHLGAEVLVTVGTSAKRELLAQRYQIPESHIFSSRAQTFKKGIFELTARQGVDVVLNSLTGDMLTDTWACIAEFGVFVEIGSPGRHQLSMQPFEKNVTLASVDLPLKQRRRPEELQKTLQSVFSMFENKQVQPVYPLTELSLSDLETAFRQVQARKHTGKIVLTAEASTLVPVLPAKVLELKLHSESVYLVVDMTKSLGSKIASFMATSGAQHINLIESKLQLEEVLGDQETMSNCRGIIHIDTGRAGDQALEEINAVDSALQQNNLDFFVMVSAIQDAIDRTATSNWKEVFANRKAKTSKNYVSLAVGSVLAEEDSREFNEYELPIKEDHLMKLLNFAIQGALASLESKQIWMGLQRPTKTGFKDDPLFSHIPFAKQEEIDSTTGTATLPIDKAIKAAKSTAQVQDLIADAIVGKISSLVAMDQDDISLDAPVSNFGLDSLIAIEFKNWISRALMAPMQTSEILDATDLVALASLITQRTTLLAEGSDSDADVTGETPTATTPEVSAKSPATSAKLVLPKLPLIDLESFLSGYYESARGSCTEKELEDFKRAIEEMRQPGGIGEKLHGRLAARAADPALENWNSEQYVRESFLDRRYPVVPYTSFFFTHALSDHEHSQAERAALIATTAFAFKQKIEAGQLEQQYLNERPLTMELYNWIFNTVREPLLGSDEMHQFKGHDHIVVFRRGRAFKVELREDGVNTPYAHLRDTFEEIILAVHDEDELELVGVLTADDRDKWAKSRAALKAVSKANAAYLSTIDSAAFTLSLDHSSPTNSSSRAHHFHFGDGSNRWNDKSIQFAITPNGISGIIGDHTMLDASTLAPLNSAINAAITSHHAEGASANNRVANGVSPIVLHPLPLTVPPSIRTEISRALESFRHNTSGWAHVFWNYDGFGGSFLRRHKIPPNSAFQVLVQLAGRRFFGRQNFCWETVSMEHFDKGRVEVNPLAWPAVVEFCDAATSASTSPSPSPDDEGGVSAKELRRLFIAACKAHSNSVYQASQGKGTERLYKALGKMLREGEKKPMLFSERLHTHTIRTFDFMSSTFQSEMPEKGYLLTYPGLEEQPDSLWIHVEVYENFAKLNITAREGRGDEYCGMFAEAAERVRGLIEMV